jgi:hypothetical protein
MDSVTVAAQQDALRPVRQFIGAISGAVSGYDQANAYSDYASYNLGRPGYQAVGPYGVSVEGTAYGLPISPTPGGGVYISPMAVLFGLGVAVALFWKK